MQLQKQEKLHFFYHSETLLQPQQIKEIRNIGKIQLMQLSNFIDCKFRIIFFSFTKKYKYNLLLIQ